MLKKRSFFFIFIIALMTNLCCTAFENTIAAIADVDVESEIDLYDTETNQSFIVDSTNSTNDLARICVPAMYPTWFTVPTTDIESMNVKYEKVIDGKKYSFASIVFSGNCTQLNSLLESTREIMYEEYFGSDVDERLRFPRIRIKLPKPWTWTRCAKCKLGVNTTITLSIAAAAIAAGTTGPGAIAVWQALIIGQYGVAAWEAVRAIVLSASVSRISEVICQIKGDCK